jgi:type IV pilus assembly protein PilA
MPCPHCGAEVLAGNTFCQRCRKRVTAPGGAPTARPALRQEPVARPATSTRSAVVRPTEGRESFQRPGWVTMLAVLAFLGGIPCLIISAAIVVPMLASSFPRSPLMWVFPVLAIGFAAFYVAVGIGLWRLRSWARYVQIVLAIMSLLAIPVGTIVGILLLVYLFRPGTKILFSGRAPAELSSEEREEVRRAGSGTTLFVIVMLLLPLFAVLIIAAIAIPSLLRARVAANEGAVREELRTIVSAEVSYAGANGGLFDDAGCLAAPAKCIPGYNGPAFLDAELFSSQTRHGYTFRFFGGPKPVPGSVDPGKVSPSGVTTFAVVAAPVQPGRTGFRTFCIDATGVGCTLSLVNERELATGQCPATCMTGR